MSLTLPVSIKRGVVSAKRCSWKLVQSWVITCLDSRGETARAEEEVGEGAAALVG